ncbi:MAG: AMP-binding protein [Deltaproteobacteria bacterium]|jgi:fatty-acyl-CoA synthase|nr:AMP-binding protein [Deltaproteobacteria bacterium]MBT4642006.1 AMP-binding protein [Deltaproteobacteria bacterium]MBT6499594.1 AMP-binding protein [Deltaproteobacteria bacterium]MBT6612016.1 AMP-binding protein [Deltaproteobacteria bacterium]MBT7151449.1 AMP-binding protein [Deltaproteobacteria bacterium]
MTLIQDVCHQAVRNHGNRIAFDSLDSQVTFDQLWDRITHVAGALSNLGIKKGDRVGILSNNCADYIVYHYATAKVGAILLVLNTRHAMDELLWALNDAEASVLVIGEDFESILGELKKGCASLNFTIGIGSVRNGDYSTRELVELQQQMAEVPDLSEKDPVLLIYTSGTTGRPKGALQTHEGSVMVDQLTADILETSPDDVYLAFMPYFHQAGLIRTRATMLNGGTNLVAGKMDPESLVSFIDRKKVSITMLVPPFDALLIKIADRDRLTLPSLRFIVGFGGGGPAHAEQMKSFCQRFNCRYMGVYGQTEVTGPATIITDADYFSKPYSCGKAMDGIDLEIWNEARKPVPNGTVGEIMIRSRTCISEYWKNEEASRSLFTGEWLNTGDLAKLDDDGFVYFMDRKKELIKTGGENVYPREVENALQSHPSIAELVIIGLPDPEGWGEKVIAVVVLKEGQSLSLEEVKAYCQGKIGGYKIPKSLQITDSIPRNHTGKILKRVLRDQFKNI